MNEQEPAQLLEGSRFKDSADVTTQVTRIGRNGYIMECEGTTVPTSATNTYCIGCVFTKTNGTAGTVKYVNQGTVTSPSFRAMTPVSVPAMVAKYAGTHTYGGGSTSSAKTVTGVVAGAPVLASVNTATNACTVRAVATTDTITFTFSADPGASTIVSYAVLVA